MTLPGVQPLLCPALARLMHLIIYTAGPYCCNLSSSTRWKTTSLHKCCRPSPPYDTRAETSMPSAVCTEPPAASTHLHAGSNPLSPARGHAVPSHMGCQKHESQMPLALHRSRRQKVLIVYREPAQRAYGDAVHPVAHKAAICWVCFIQSRVSMLDIAWTSDTETCSAGFGTA